MKKQIMAILLAVSLGTVPYSMPVPAEEVKTESSALEDGLYECDFDTDSSMFHVNEVCDGKAILTVKDGLMTMHITLVSKNITALFKGLARDAESDGAELILPTLDHVTYPDGWEEDVYGFDVPVDILEEEFDLALIGKKGNWYDHKVSVKNTEKIEENAQNPAIIIGERI